MRLLIVFIQLVRLRQGGTSKSRSLKKLNLDLWGARNATQNTSVAWLRSVVGYASERAV